MPSCTRRLPGASFCTNRFVQSQEPPSVFVLLPPSASTDTLQSPWITGLFPDIWGHLWPPLFFLPVMPYCPPPLFSLSFILELQWPLGLPNSLISTFPSLTQAFSLPPLLTAAYFLALPLPPSLNFILGLLSDPFSLPVQDVNNLKVGHRPFSPFLRLICTAKGNCSPL